MFIVHYKNGNLKREKNENGSIGAVIEKCKIASALPITFYILVVFGDCKDWKFVGNTYQSV